MVIFNEKFIASLTCLFIALLVGLISTYCIKRMESKRNFKRNRNLPVDYSNVEEAGKPQRPAVDKKEIKEPVEEAGKPQRPVEEAGKPQRPGVERKQIQRPVEVTDETEITVNPAKYSQISQFPPAMKAQVVEVARPQLPVSTDVTESSSTTVAPSELEKMTQKELNEEYQRVTQGKTKKYLNKKLSGRGENLNGVETLVIIPSVKVKRVLKDGKVKQVLKKGEKITRTDRTAYDLYSAEEIMVNLEKTDFSRQDEKRFLDKYHIFEPVNKFEDLKNHSLWYNLKNGSFSLRCEIKGKKEILGPVSSEEMLREVIYLQQKKFYFSDHFYVELRIQNGVVETNFSCYDETEFNALYRDEDSEETYGLTLKYGVEKIIGHYRTSSVEGVSPLSVTSYFVDQGTAALSEGTQILF